MHARVNVVGDEGLNLQAFPVVPVTTVRSDVLSVPKGWSGLREAASVEAEPRLPSSPFQSRE